MARRGSELREHILWTAKDVFLQMGYERASMDAVAAQASTSKRSLYAHFESKEKLFLAVVDFTRGLYLGGLKTPGEYSDDPDEAVVLFCGRFLQSLLQDHAVRTTRLGIAAADRLPEAAEQYYDAIFAETHERLSAYLTEQYQLTPKASTEIAYQLVGRTMYPRLVAALFGVGGPLKSHADETKIATDVDLKPIRALVASLLPSRRSTPRRRPARDS